jgi:hypothetical protein
MGIVGKRMPSLATGVCVLKDESFMRGLMHLEGETTVDDDELLERHSTSPWRRRG